MNAHRAVRPVIVEKQNRNYSDHGVRGRPDNALRFSTEGPPFAHKAKFSITALWLAHRSEHVLSDHPHVRSVRLALRGEPVYTKGLASKAGPDGTGLQFALIRRRSFNHSFDRGPWGMTCSSPPAKPARCRTCRSATPALRGWTPGLLRPESSARSASRRCRAASAIRARCVPCLP